MGLFARGPKQPPPPPSLEEQVAENAWLWERFSANKLGVTLDGSRASLDQVDALLGRMYDAGQVLPDNAVDLVTAYVLEVARRQYGGFYAEGDTAEPVLLVVGTPDDPRVVVHARGRIVGRMTNGPEDDLGFFVDGIAGLRDTPGTSRLE